MRYFPPFLFCLALATTARAQQPATPSEPAIPIARPLCPLLTGIVTDDQLNPLTGATVVVEGINDAYSTNSQGQYIVTSRSPIPMGARLKVSAAGYETQQLALTGCQTPAITLHTLPGTRFRRDGRIKKTTNTGKVK